MKHLIHLVCCMTFLLAIMAIGQADTTADALLGQLNYTQNAPNSPSGLPTAGNLALSNAAHLAIARNGRLYVADSDNNRVLSWPSASLFTVGQPADLVIGQPDFTSFAPGATATAFNLPQGLCVDRAGNLWVADAFNSRVLKFIDPATTDKVADLVLGQPDFTSSAPNLGRGPVDVDAASADSLCFPGRVWVGENVVIVADSGNSRVILYPTPTTNKPDATRVWGQFASFNCRAKNNDGACNDFGSTTARNLFNPIGIAVGLNRRLYVCDWNNNRVVWFEDYLTGDDIADGVIGQPDLLSSACGGGAISLCQPIDVAVGAGRMIVADAGNNRVLAFALPNQIAANTVFGQLGSFAGNTVNHGLGLTLTDADGLFGPTAVAVDSSLNLLVADTLNNRVLRFDAPFGRRLHPAPAAGGLVPTAVHPVFP